MMARGNGAHARERDSDIKANQFFFVCFFCLGVNNDLYRLNEDFLTRVELWDEDDVAL